MASPIVTQLVQLLQDLYGETQGFLERPDDAQLWYNRGYANGIVLAFRELGYLGALPAGVTWDPDREAWDQIAAQSLTPWGRAHAHGLEMGRRETREVLEAD
jgi:hypothetical protein